MVDNRPRQVKSHGVRRRKGHGGGNSEGMWMCSLREWGRGRTRDAEMTGTGQGDNLSCAKGTAPGEVIGETLQVSGTATEKSTKLALELYQRVIIIHSPKDFPTHSSSNKLHCVLKIGFTPIFQ